ncbi:MAG: aminopeptidase P family protein [Coriobacteriales bacterium]|jgi:Xaa-Pro aminopeptidase|nr:aminopeptidase P family protein [Coriobacteriales bacterium]
MIEHRLKRLLDVLAEQNIDVYLATHTADIRWLTGFSGVFDEEQAHLVLIAGASGVATSGASDAAPGGEATPGAEALFFTDSRYSGALRQLDEQGRWRILDERRPRYAYVVEMLKSLRGGHGQSKTLRIGIEADLRLNAYRSLGKALDEQASLSCELIELSDLISGLRAVKDVQEVEMLRAAQAITDAAFLHMLDYLRPGLTEREAAIELEFFMRNAGAQGLAFPSIVAAGPHSAIPHAIPGERVFERGDFVLMDFGARLDDYRSDMTRTVVLGTASERQRAMYAAVRAAQRAVIDALVPGMRGCEAQDIADATLAAHGFEGRLIHSLGHGVGIDIHELPVLAPKAEAKLEVGQVITVEPGVYFEDIGGVRIEDFGVITEDGFDDFTQSSHELIEL